MGTAQVQVAKAEGIYRCSGDGQTWFRERGQELTPCSCGKGTWEFLAGDNLNPADTIPILVGRGIIMLIYMDALPEVGVMLNLRGPEQLTTKYSGRFRVTYVGTFRWCGKDEFHIQVDPAGAFDEEQPIYTMAELGI